MPRKSTVKAALDRVTSTPARPRRKPADISEEELIEVLSRNDYKLGPTAKELGMSRTTLYTLIDKSPNIRKARDLTIEDIEQALLAEEDIDRAAAALRVSARGLRLRMKELGLT